jgi:Holliday junction resolvasome RuvABC endonuclease subunit
MTTERKKTLAIDPGTRNIGFALLDNGDLVHYGVKTIGRAQSPHYKRQEGRKFISRLIEDFRPQSLLVEKTFFANNRNSALLNAMADEVGALGRRRKLSVRSLAANTVRKAICGNGAASKEDVARAIVSRYPELKPYLSSDRRWKERYHRNMFDAVALAVAFRMVGGNVRSTSSRI